MSLVTYCSKHPKYTVQRFPRGSCRECKHMYAVNEIRQALQGERKLDENGVPYLKSLWGRRFGGEIR